MYIVKRLDEIEGRASTAASAWSSKDDPSSWIGHLKTSADDIPALVAALRAVLAIETARVGPDMYDCDIDQSEGWNDAIKTIRAAIAAALDG